MKLFNKISGNLSSQADERETQVRQNASWRGLLVLFVTYLAVLTVYELKAMVMPWSTNLLFLVGFITFVYYILKGDGFSFAIPGVKENSETLNQPTAVRAVPWVLFMIYSVTTAISLIAAPNSIYFKDLNIAPALAYIIAFVASIIGLYINWYIAARIRYGSKFWIGLFILGAFYTLFQLPIDFNYLMNTKLFSSQANEFLYMNGSYSPGNLILLNDIAIIWAGYILTKNHKLLTSQKIEIKNSPLNKKKLFYALGSYAVAIIAVILLAMSGIESLGIAAIVLGAIVVLSLIMILFYLLGKGFFEGAGVIGKMIDKDR